MTSLIRVSRCRQQLFNTIHAKLTETCHSTSSFAAKERPTLLTLKTVDLEQILDPAAGFSRLVLPHLVSRPCTIPSALPVQHDDLRQKIDKHMSELSGADDKVISEQPSGLSAEDEGFPLRINLTDLAIRTKTSSCFMISATLSLMCESQILHQSSIPPPYRR